MLQKHLNNLQVNGLSTGECVMTGYERVVLGRLSRSQARMELSSPLCEHTIVESVLLRELCNTSPKLFAVQHIVSLQMIVFCFCSSF